MSWLWFLLPDQGLIFLIVGLGIALILGLVAGRTALNILGLLILIPMLSPFVESFFGAMPPWISLLVLVIVVLSILRGLGALFIGRRASDHMVGILAADVVRVIFMCLFLPFRMMGWLIRTIGNGRP